jgi:ATP-dependent exoDNAse (exonuclease V) alpha subunit
MGRADFLYTGFVSRLKYDPTPCQDTLLHKIADFVSSDDSDILVVNGYAGTGKTTAISSVISVMKEYGTKCVLLAPTGRAAKVLSSYSGQPAFTVHKHIYRQKSVGGDGFGQFTLSPNKDKQTLFIVDEASLIGIDAGQQQSTASFGTGDLLEDLISFVRSGVECKLILIGDSAQLPPVGLEVSPALHLDYMDSHGGVEYAELTTVVRQQQESGILHNATLVRYLIGELETGCGVMDLCDLGLEIEGFDDVERKN